MRSVSCELFACCKKMFQFAKAIERINNMSRRGNDLDRALNMDDQPPIDLEREWLQQLADARDRREEEQRMEALESARQEAEAREREREAKEVAAQYRRDAEEAERYARAYERDRDEEVRRQAEEVRLDAENSRRIEEEQRQVAREARAEAHRLANQRASRR